MHLSRRNFLDAAALLALASPLSARAAVKGKAARAPDDAVAMAQAVRDGKTTPQQLVEGAIARLEKANPRINCVALPNFDRARAQAANGVAGPFAGVPTLIKDNIDQKGLPNTNALKLFQGNIAAKNDPYVDAIERAGLISIGRSTLPELASNVTTESALTGITRNPWNPDYSSGGSSGGASAAVAAGVVPIAHGNDYAGSIRHAAAPTGLVGLKASRGRMAGDEKSRDAAQQLIQGALSRTVRDTAAWFAATETSSPDAPYPPVGLVTSRPARKLRIGIRQDIPRTGAKPSIAVQRVFERSAALLERLGHDVREAPLAYAPATTDAYVELWQAKLARFFAGLEKRIGRPLAPGDIERRLREMGVAGEATSDARMAECQQIVATAGARHAAQFETWDIYMTPVFSTEPIRIGELAPDGAWSDQRERLIDYACYCWIDNVAGTPAITLPMGMSDGRLPIGIQFAARPGAERLLIELAYSLEDEVRWAEKLPPIWVG